MMQEVKRGRPPKDQTQSTFMNSREKLEFRRKQNKIAATRYRNKQRDRILELEEEIDKLIKESSEKDNEIAYLKQELHRHENSRNSFDPEPLLRPTNFDADLQRTLSNPIADSNDCIRREFCLGFDQFEMEENEPPQRKLFPPKKLSIHFTSNQKFIPTHRQEEVENFSSPLSSSIHPSFFSPSLPIPLHDPLMTTETITDDLKNHISTGWTPFVEKNPIQQFELLESHRKSSQNSIFLQQL